MWNQFTLDHIIQKKVKNRIDIIKYIRFIYDFYELLKGCKNSGNFVCCRSHWMRWFVWGPCFQVLFFKVQQSSC